ncbi:LuxR C-terminal-related transcriptional regulator [Yokenella regensburgei]|uniref:LuxR C-terminal-related transcriptional regulator n=1 Tax=Yokenella regensburgei TaxID=158877 RepID=UPI003D9C76DB
MLSTLSSQELRTLYLRFNRFLAQNIARILEISEKTVSAHRLSRLKNGAVTA